MIRSVSALTAIQVAFGVNTTMDVRPSGAVGVQASHKFMRKSFGDVNAQEGMHVRSTGEIGVHASDKFMRNRESSGVAQETTVKAGQDKERSVTVQQKNDQAVVRGLSSSSSTSSPLIWLYDAHSDACGEPWYGNMFSPLVWTLRDAFENDGCRVAVACPSDTNQSEILQSIRNRSSAILIAYGYNMDRTGLSKAFLQQAAQLGVYLIIYNIEPLSALGGCAWWISVVRALNAREMWDFSDDNLALCGGSVRAGLMSPGSRADLIMRYVPPGYSRQLDFDVDVDSPLREESKIGFVGRWYDEAQQKQYRTMLGTMLVETNNKAFDESSQKDFLTRYPVQLNRHHVMPGMGTSTVMEAFRLALLVSNKACVISSPASEHDNWHWRDIVIFANVSNTTNAFEALKGHVQECRKGAFNTFQRRFAPSRILSNSGFAARFTPWAAFDDSSLISN